MEYILNLDRSLLYLINKGSSAPFLDPIMVFLSSSYPWIVLLGGVVFWGLYNRGAPFLKIALALVLLVSLTDLMAFRVLKPSIARQRPCIELKDIRTTVSCGGEFGFPSNHSANAVAITVFLHFLLRRRLLTLLLASFSLLVGYSRVYLGAHYPLDVLMGYLLGAVIALGIYFPGRKYFL